MVGVGRMVGLGGGSGWGGGGRGWWGLWGWGSGWGGGRSFCGLNGKLGRRHRFDPKLVGFCRLNHQTVSPSHQGGGS